MASPRCVLAGVDGHVCNGRLQDHHCVKRQRIRREFPRGAWRYPGGIWEPIPRAGLDAALSDEGRPVRGFETLPLPGILGDPRNRVWACVFSAHPKVEGDYSLLPPDVMERVLEFAREFGLVAQLENDIARQS